MPIPTVKSLWAFVPAKDYQRSRQFYRAMGFEETFSNDDVTGFRLGAGTPLRGVSSPRANRCDCFTSAGAMATG
jgi:catechol 2,3-dioxygenase-like lactoylglutathione lyase family enzyme